MTPESYTDIPGDDLTSREQSVLGAVIRSYVDTAEPAGSRTVARQFDLGISPATVRNTMSDLEAKGYLFHPHTSAGRVPTDLAYRFFVDCLIQPAVLTKQERGKIAKELDGAGPSAVERLVRRAAKALSLLSMELGVAVAPSLIDATLERLELIQISGDKVLLVATILGGTVRTVYVDLPNEVPRDTLVTLTVVLNERLAGLTLKQIRDTLPERLRDAWVGDGPGGGEFLNIFMQSGTSLFQWPPSETGNLHLGKASVLAAQPEFSSGEQLKGLMELTERTDLLTDVLASREHEGGVRITIGNENDTAALSDFTLVTAEYRLGGLKGVIGVIGPTRMPYDKVIAIVDHTSSLVSTILDS